MINTKKVGVLPVENSEEFKQTNEIKMAIPLLEGVDIQGKDVSADALLTQRKLAEYLVVERKAHYHFTVKGNQKSLLEATLFGLPMLGFALPGRTPAPVNQAVLRAEGSPVVCAHRPQAAEHRQKPAQQVAERRRRRQQADADQTPRVRLQVGDRRMLRLDDHGLFRFPGPLSDPSSGVA